MKQEEWKVIEGFEDYEVSSFGRIKSLKGNKQLIRKTNLKKDGYISVILYNNN